MSKSDSNENNIVSLLDDPKTIEKKCKKAVTDSDSDIRYDEQNKPGVSNLLTIYSAFRGMSMEETEAHFAGKMYGHLKMECAEAIISGLTPIQQKYNEYMSDKATLETILGQGAENAQRRASRMMQKVYRKIGLVQPKRF